MHDEALETYEIGEIKGTVYQDYDPLNPRSDYDCHAGVLTQLSNDYCQPGGTDDGDDRIVEAWGRGYGWRANGSRGSGRGYFRDQEIVERYARAFLGAVAVGWLDDPRSSSRIFGYVTADKCKELGVEDPAKCLQAELDEYGQWCEGDVYGIVIEGPNGVDESCWGYYGYDYAIQQMKDDVKFYADKARDVRLDMYRKLVNNGSR